MQKKEEKVQLAVCDYIRRKYPNTIFTCDLASGMKLRIHVAAMHKRMRSSRGLPDLFIAKASVKSDETGKAYKRYNGLFIELKREGFAVFKKGGKAVRAGKHLEEQYEVLQALEEEGYKAVFACGFNEAVKIIDEYLG
jgi:hypothetical protein